MGIREFLDNPNGGQVLTGLMVLSGGIAGMGLCIYAGISMLLQSRLSEIKGSDVQFAVLSGVIIASAVGFLRSRLAPDEGER